MIYHADKPDEEEYLHTIKTENEYENYISGNNYNYDDINKDEDVDENKDKHNA